MIAVLDLHVVALLLAVLVIFCLGWVCGMAYVVATEKLDDDLPELRRKQLERLSVIQGDGAEVRVLPVVPLFDFDQEGQG